MNLFEYSVHNLLHNYFCITIINFTLLSQNSRECFFIKKALLQKYYFVINKNYYLQEKHEQSPLNYIGDTQK